MVSNIDLRKTVKKTHDLVAKLVLKLAIKTVQRKDVMPVEAISSSQLGVFKSVVTSQNVTSQNVASQNVATDQVTAGKKRSNSEFGCLKYYITKIKDAKKYKILKKYLDRESKEKLGSLPLEEKVMIAEIFKNSSDDRIVENTAEKTKIQKQFLNNLIDIFQDDSYFKLKDCFTSNKVDMYFLKNYRIGDINDYLDKTKTTPEEFFQGSGIVRDNFITIMDVVNKIKFENEEIKNQVKENLYELANNGNLKKRNLSQQDIASIIKFLTDKNKIMEKMEILKQLKLFDNYNRYHSGYNVKDKLEVFNTFVEMIPENESFLDYKDKIIDCVNKSAKASEDAHTFLENVLKPNIATIKGKDYKTLLDRMMKCPYYFPIMPDIYCDVIFDNDNKYGNTSILILNLILHKGPNKLRFQNLYNKYLPMLQKADDKTLRAIKLDMLTRLYKLYEFLNKIQVNNEDISLESLPFQQLKELQTLLIQNNFNDFFKDIDISFLNKNIDKIFIKNDNKIDFDSTLFEVNKLLSVKHLDLSQTQKDNINNILKVKANLANIDFEKIKIVKTNSFEILKSKVKNILENDNSIGDNDKTTILAKFTNDIDSLMFNKLPQDLNQLEVMKKIKKEISKYFTFNKVPNEENTYTIGDVKISGVNDKTKSTLEFIFKAIPELVVLLGVNQGGHNFDIGKHILAVGKEVVKNDKFQNLSQNNQKLVLIAALMHDIAKIDGGLDVSHPQRESQYAYNILNDVLSDDDKTTVANLIFNHHFGASMANVENNTPKMYTLAYECKDKNPEFLNMLEILSKADLLGDDESYKIRTGEYLKQIPKLIGALKKKIKKVDGILAKLKDTLKLTPFPQKTLASTEDGQIAMQKCKELGIVGEFKSGDITIDKIDFAKMKGLSPDEQKKYLSLLGFNTSYNKLEFLIHTIEGKKSIEGVDYLTSQFKSDATLSTSIITMANTAIYGGRKYGFIMEPDKTKVLSAAPSNMNSGFFKRRNQSGQFIREYKTDEDYDALSKYIQDSRLKAQDKHSEAVTIDNEVAAIFVKEGCEDKIPKELVEFAYKRHLPLIIVPRS
ncbi:MAG: HD domain-containing protein [Candidatus Gastranaerophilales bacterium]|nr:HD domain-containing protein [Candidatus Gastranaerophilales bacterium]